MAYTYISLHNGLRTWLVAHCYSRKNKSEGCQENAANFSTLSIKVQKEDDD